MSDTASRPIIFGEVLFDRFPDGAVVLGGAPFNVAWHLQAFGQAPLFISRVGKDPLGQRIRDTMRDWGMDTAGLQSDAEHPTGTVEVSFRDGEPHYEIVHDRAYDFIDADVLPGVDQAALLYHGSLALRGEVSRRAFRELSRRLAVPRFLDVNLRAPWWQSQAVRDMMSGSTWLKLNEQELSLLGNGDDAAQPSADSVRRDYGLDALILTRGSRGAIVVGPEPPLSVAPVAAQQVVDTVGAGDGFTSVILLGLLRHWSWDVAMERAQAFASGIVGRRGATVADPAFYARFLRQWGLDGGGS